MSKSTVKNYRIYTGFSKAPDNDVSNLALGVADSLTDNPAYLNTPVDPTALKALQATFITNQVNARNGGTDRTRAKNAARQALVDALMQDALYCQGLARHDLDTLLSSGYDVVSTNRTSGPLDTPSIISIDNSVSGQLTVRGQSVLNGRIYQMQTSTDGGKTWTDAGNYNGARIMLLQPTTPGTTYMVQICALGGSTGQSAWSNPVSSMST